MAASGKVHVVFVHGLFSSPVVWSDFTRLIDTDRELATLVDVHCFPYDSPIFRRGFFWRIADFDDVADRLATYLSHDLADAESIVLVSHSQGGLIVQRHLARMLSRGRGRELARIKRILLFACPNGGSEFLLSVRRFAGRFWRHKQERALRPLDRSVIEAQEKVLRAVVNANGCDDTQCAIPIDAYGGMNDAIVPPKSANWLFPSRELVDGDHFGCVRPKSHRETSYIALRRRVLAVAAEPETPPPEFPTLTPRTTEPPMRGGSVTPPFGRRQDGHLQGRGELIEAVMARSAPNRVHVLAGLGGSGKSRLALEIAYRAKEQGRRVWWVEMPRIASSMRILAGSIGVPEGQITQAWGGGGSPTDLIWEFLDRLDEPWLLVLDNADEPQRLGPQHGAVSDGTGWLREPAGAAGMVVVTSRDRREETWGGWCTVHKVLPFNDVDGAFLLMDRLGNRAGTEPEARALSRQLGGLPLALRGAADYLNAVLAAKIPRAPHGIGDFNAYRAAVAQRFSHPPGAGPDLNDRHGLEIVGGVFKLSLDLLTQRGLPHAAPLLKLFACLAFAPIPHLVLLAGDLPGISPLLSGITPAQRHEALVALNDLGLIEAEPREGAEPDLANVLALHPLVHGILREDDDVRRRRGEYYGLAIALLRAATADAPPDLTESWKLWSVLAPHCIEVTKAPLVCDEPLRDRRVVTEALGLARMTARYLIVTGLLGPAHDLVESLVGARGGFDFDADDPRILALRHERARILLESGEPVTAEAELREVIAGRETVLGPMHADTLASRHKLAKSILEQNRWEEAEPLLRKIVADEYGVRGPEHYDTMAVRHSLARAVLQLERFGEAEMMLRDILEVRLRRWSTTDPETLFVRKNLAVSLVQQGRADEAEAEIKGALVLVADRPRSREAMSLRATHATVLIARQRASEAVDGLTSLLADQRRALGESHPNVDRTRRQLALARELHEEQKSRAA